MQQTVLQRSTVTLSANLSNSIVPKPHLLLSMEPMLAPLHMRGNHNRQLPLRRTKFYSVRLPLIVTARSLLRGGHSMDDEKAYFPFKYGKNGVVSDLALTTTHRFSAI